MHKLNVRVRMNVINYVELGSEQVVLNTRLHIVGETNHHCKTLCPILTTNAIIFYVEVTTKMNYRC